MNTNKEILKSIAEQDFLGAKELVSKALRAKILENIEATKEEVAGHFLNPIKEDLDHSPGGCTVPPSDELSDAEKTKKVQEGEDFEWYSPEELAVVNAAKAELKEQEPYKSNDEKLKNDLADAMKAGMTKDQLVAKVLHKEEANEGIERTDPENTTKGWKIIARNPDVQRNSYLRQKGDEEFNPMQVFEDAYADVQQIVDSVSPNGEVRLGDGSTLTPITVYKRYP